LQKAGVKAGEKEEQHVVKKKKNNKQTNTPADLKSAFFISPHNGPSRWFP